MMKNWPRKNLSLNKWQEQTWTNLGQVENMKVFFLKKKQNWARKSVRAKPRRHGTKGMAKVYLF